jgi:CheY-like chemotaxis protein
MIIEVHDSGIGISPDKFDLLFQRFSTLHDIGGTGLGLALCKKVASRMGGNVVLQKSVLNIGSVFQVQLPLQKSSLPHSLRTEFKQVFQKLSIPLDLSLPIVGHLIENKGESEFFDFICRSIGLQTYGFSSPKEVHNWIASLSGRNGILVCDLKAFSDESVSNLKEFEDIMILLMPPDYLSYQKKVLASHDLSDQSDNSSRTKVFDLLSHSSTRIHPPIRRSELLETILRCHQRHISGPRIDKSLKPSSLKDLKVLIVEDNRVNQKVLSRMLSALGIETIALAENGLECVNYFKSRLSVMSNSPTDVVLMDLQMPVMNGTVATKEIRNLYSNPALCKDLQMPFIVAVTASVSASQKGQIIEQGFDDCLLKPLSKSELEQCLLKFSDRIT